MTDTTGQIATDPIIDRVAPTALSTCCRAVGQSLAGAVRPRRPDPARIARLREALVAPPASSVTVRLRALPQIPRVVRSMTVLEGVRSPATIRMDMRTYVIDHPSARILLDPSVASQVRERVLGAMQPMLRAAVMPSPDVLSTVEALHRGGVDPASVDLALSTHLHWDHVSGLLDLPALPLIAHRREHEWAVAGELAPAAGVRPALAGRTMDLRDLDGPPAEHPRGRVGLDELVVAGSHEKVQRWSTDPRSRVPALPDVSPGAALPRCVRTVHRGRTLYDRDAG